MPFWTLLQEVSICLEIKIYHRCEEKRKGNTQLLICKNRLMQPLPCKQDYFFLKEIVHTYKITKQTPVTRNITRTLETFVSMRISILNFLFYLSLWFYYIIKIYMYPYTISAPYCIFLHFILLYDCTIYFFYRWWKMGCFHLFIVFKYSWTCLLGPCLS